MNPNQTKMERNKGCQFYGCTFNGNVQINMS